MGKAHITLGGANRTTQEYLAYPWIQSFRSTMTKESMAKGQGQQCSSRRTPKIMGGTMIKRAFTVTTPNARTGPK